MIFAVLLVLEIFLLYVLMRRTLNRIYRILGPMGLAILFLPGTFIHEMSHFLTALFLLVPVGQIDLMPKMMDEGVKLGSVPIGKTDPIRRTLIGVAPIIFGLAIILGSIFYVHTHNLFGNKIVLIVLALISFEVANTMFSSKKDLEGALAVFIAVILIYGIFYLLGLRVSLEIDPEILKMASLFLLIPIGVDVVMGIF